jgi:hypothetical protein
MIRAHTNRGSTDDPSVTDVIEHLLREFEDQLGSDAIFRIVLSCRAELTECPHSALPERMRRLAHRRLSAATPPAASRSRPAVHPEWP